MSASAIVGASPTLLIRGRRYPVLLPTVRDPRLHLAAVIVSLQVLGQTAFGFRLSIAQILISLLTCAVLEVGIAFWRQRVVMWPASALLTGNGVAFILRVPGTRHGDWWSLHGASIFAATAAVALISKYVIRFRGRHVFNPSNFGLVLCFLLLGDARAEPLDFWWGPMSAWLALAVAIILASGLIILSRLRMLSIALGFWIAFAAGVGIVAASGHSMTARWHLGPISGGLFWWVLVSSPEILVFLFFMITDPKTVPAGRVARFVYAVAVGLLAALLVAPQTTEFGSKVAVLIALAIVCAARSLLDRLLPAPGSTSDRLSAWAARLVRGGRFGAGGRRLAAGGALSATGAVAFGSLLVVAGIPARSSDGTLASTAKGTLSRVGVRDMPEVTVAPSKDVASQIDRRAALLMARDVLADLQIQADALRRRDLERAAAGAGGAWLLDLQRRIRGAKAGPIVVPSYHVERLRVTLASGSGQAGPAILVTLQGTVERASYAGSPPKLGRRSGAIPLHQTIEIASKGSHYLIVAANGAESVPRGNIVVGTAKGVGPYAGGPVQNLGKSAAGLTTTTSSSPFRDASALSGLKAKDQVWETRAGHLLRYLVTGQAWADYDRDGWVDLYVTNQLGGNTLYHNNGDGTFSVSPLSVEVSLPTKMSGGAVFADYDNDGWPDLYVMDYGRDVLFHNDHGKGFTDVTAQARITDGGRGTTASWGDYDRDGYLDLYVANYGCQPCDHPKHGDPDRLYHNNGDGTFTDVSSLLPEKARDGFGFVAGWLDYDNDGDPDLYLVNDVRGTRHLPGNALFRNDGPGCGAWCFTDVSKRSGAGVRVDGMGLAVGDYNGDGNLDLYVSNSGWAMTPLTGPAVLLRNDGDGTFTEVAQKAGVDVDAVAWGTAFLDYDNDGQQDLYVAVGSDPADLGPQATLDHLLRNRGNGTFDDVSWHSGASYTDDTFGVASADANNDGWPDILVGSLQRGYTLYENTGLTGRGNNRLVVWLHGAGPVNRDAVGARVYLTTNDGRSQMQEIMDGSSLGAGNDLRLEFGLGKHSVRGLRVVWPNGREQEFDSVPANVLWQLTYEERPSSSNLSDPASAAQASK